MAGVTEQALEPQAGQRGDPLDEIDGGRRVRVDPAAVQADVHLHEHVDLASRGAQDVGPAARDVEMIHDEGEPGAVEQREHAVAVGRVQRVGQADVFDAMIGEDLRFPQLRAADADGAARDLDRRQVGALVRLDVRP